MICAVAEVAGALVVGESGMDGSVNCLVPVLQVRPHLLLCFDGLRGDGDGVEKMWVSSRRRLVSSSFSLVLDDERWRLLKLHPSHGCDVSGRGPASSISPVTVLVEGRPLSFLPASVPKGRQFQPQLGGRSLQVLQLWRPRRTKWSVPGAGAIQSEEMLLGTRSRFLVLVRGPFCISQGLCCSFQFLLGFLVKCTAPTF
uniref:Salt-induced protein 3 n=1 Tax=Leymus chinensis TaxID=52714 RepID=A0A7S9I6W5_LEYCH|nr:salt-induced protein 3 [Leymus chinensis]